MTRLALYLWAINLFESVILKAIRALDGPHPQTESAPTFPRAQALSATASHQHFAFYGWTANALLVRLPLSRYTSDANLSVVRPQ